VIFRGRLFAVDADDLLPYLRGGDPVALAGDGGFREAADGIQARVWSRLRTREREPRDDDPWDGSTRLIPGDYEVWVDHFMLLLEQPEPGVYRPRLRADAGLVHVEPFVPALPDLEDPDGWEPLRIPNGRRSHVVLRLSCRRYAFIPRLYDGIAGLTLLLTGVAIQKELSREGGARPIHVTRRSLQATSDLAVLAEQVAKARGWTRAGTRLARVGGAVGVVGDGVDYYVWWHDALDEDLSTNTEGFRERVHVYNTITAGGKALGMAGSALMLFPPFAPVGLAAKAVGGLLELGVGLARAADEWGDEEQAFFERVWDALEAEAPALRAHYRELQEGTRLPDWRHARKRADALTEAGDWESIRDRDWPAIRALLQTVWVQ